MDSSVLGLAVHVYADYRRGRVFVVGRLADGRSFAAEDAAWRPTVYLRAADSAVSAVRQLGLGFQASALVALDGSALVAWTAPGFGAYRDAVERLGALGVAVQGGGSMADLYRADRHLGLGVRISGVSRPGHRVDVVFGNALVEPDDEADAPLSVLSIDIETDESDRSVRAVSLAMADWVSAERQLTRRITPTEVLLRAVTGGSSAVTRAPSASALSSEGSVLKLVEILPDERSLLSAFARRVVALDPDVITGWNVVDFDLARLVERAEAHGLVFDVGRSRDGAKILPGGRGSTTTAIIPGRQVIDAMRVARSGPERYEDYTLETVARSVLSRGKGTSLRGAAKLAELDRMYQDDLPAFADYAAEDALLVLDVLAGTGLFALTLARARLVGIGLDRAWTSVAAFERAYGEALRAAGAVPPPFEPGRNVSGAAGGTVLPAAAGYREGVVVLDFKSLYPSVMRTFCIDPMANERARHAGAGLGGSVEPEDSTSGDIVAPNGARFAREHAGRRWPLPGLVDTYFARREDAMARKDATGSYVYKILMNSFYGVLGTSSCRYARTELAGAITSFGRLVLLRAKARIERDGSTVLYGDTDSLFVATGLGPDAPYTAYRERGDALCALVNTELAAMAEAEYGVASRLELRFDKAYARFIIPPLRMSEDNASKTDFSNVAERARDNDEPAAVRGRAKGYAGLLRASDGDRIDVKGMEAVRSDWTPLAREFQVRLLTLAFSGALEAELGEYLASVLDALRAGELDARLVYTRSLRRSESAYVKSTPPHVKAARLAGLVGRGRVSYIIGEHGPAPVDPDTYGLSGPGEPRPDYRHYIDKQLLPIARSLAASGLPVPLGAFGLEKTQGELF